MNQSQVTQLVRRIVTGMPIEVFDEETQEVWENDLWELVHLRPKGDFAGTRYVGSANMIAALNMIHQKLLIRASANDDCSDLSHKMFYKALEELEDEKVIRKKPEYVRSTFKIV